MKVIYTDKRTGREWAPDETMIWVYRNALENGETHVADHIMEMINLDYLVNSKPVFTMKAEDFPGLTVEQKYTCYERVADDDD